MHFIAVFLNAYATFIALQTNLRFTLFYCKYEEYSGYDNEVSFIDHFKALKGSENY